MYTYIYICICILIYMTAHESYIFIFIYIVIYVLLLLICIFSIHTYIHMVPIGRPAASSQHPASSTKAPETTSPLLIHLRDLKTTRYAIQPKKGQ